MRAIEHARRHLASLSPERRAQLEAEWKGSTVDRIVERAKEGREALATHKTPILEGLAVIAFVAVMPVAMVLS